MKRIDLLYKNLLRLLGNLTLEGDGFTEFHGSLEPAEQEDLITLAENILNEKQEILKACVRNEFYPDFTDLIGVLDSFTSKFPEYPNFREGEIYTIIALAQKLYSEYIDEDIDFLKEQVDIDLFSLIKIEEVIFQDNFLHFDEDDIEKSMILININEKEIFNNFISEPIIGTHLFFYLLGKIGIDGSPLTGSKYIFAKAGLEANPKMVWATLCLYIVKSGEIIHEPQEYILPPSVSSDCEIQLGHPYQQFIDSIEILSEYNYQKDILDKYLRIYHVIENFMFKHPLVQIEKKSNGEVFSIRDFKRMYDSVSGRELQTLKNLFIQTMQFNFNPTTTFAEKFFTEWNNLVPAYFAGDDSKVNILISILGITKKDGSAWCYNEIDRTMIPNFVSRLVYAFRNSMVHNRETEFHLTHLSLNNHKVLENTARIVLESFLLPLMEEISFYLILKKNDLVWYDTSHLTLWKES